MLLLSLILNIILTTVCDPNRNVPDEYLNISEIFQKHGYIFQEFEIETEDGYLLDLFRISTNQTSNTAKYPVLLVHGLLASSESFIFPDRNRSLPYLLADANYDVWLANCRGSMHSRKHRSLDPDHDPAFWFFSWHEIGLYDLPAFIDFILKKTGYSKLFYIGHSQGTTVFFVMASERPEYNEKINLSINLGPSVFVQRVHNVLVKIISRYYLFLDALSVVLNQLEFVPFISNDNLRRIEVSLCNEKSALKELCWDIFALMVGCAPGQIDKTRIPYVVSTFPSGASTRQLLHYAQSITNGDFEQYDFGVYGNQKRYKSDKPPKYAINNITSPIALFYADNDGLNTVQDVKRLHKTLPNVVDFYEVPFRNFGHDDFVLAKDIKRLVYDRVFDLLHEYLQP